MIFERDGEAQVTQMRKEVILAAGAFGTPQLLELSDIGNAEVLKAQGIDVVYENAAVGESLQDHIRAGISYEATVAIMQGSMTKEEAEELYEMRGSGPWAEMATHLFAYMPLTRLCEATDIQQLERTFQEHIGVRDEGSSQCQRKHNDFVKHALSLYLRPAQPLTLFGNP